MQLLSRLTVGAVTLAMLAPARAETVTVPAALHAFVPGDTIALARIHNLAQLEERLQELLASSNPEAAALLRGTSPTAMLGTLITGAGEVHTDHPMYAAVLPGPEGAMIPPIRLFLQVAGGGGVVSAMPPFSYATTLEAPWVVVSNQPLTPAAAGAQSGLIAVMPAGDAAIAASLDTIRPDITAGVMDLPDPVAQRLTRSLGATNTLGAGLTLDGDSAELLVQFNQAAPRSGQGMDAVSTASRLAAHVSNGATVTVLGELSEIRPLAEMGMEALSGGTSQDPSDHPPTAILRVAGRLLKEAAGPVAIALTQGTDSDPARPQVGFSMVMETLLKNPTDIQGDIRQAVKLGDDADELSVVAVSATPRGIDAWHIHGGLGDGPATLATACKGSALQLCLASSDVMAMAALNSSNPAPSLPAGVVTDGWLGGASLVGIVDIRSFLRWQALMERLESGGTPAQPELNLVPAGAPVWGAAGLWPTSTGETVRLRTNIKALAALVRDAQPIEAWEVNAAARSGDLDQLRRFIAMAPGNFPLDQAGRGANEQTPLMAAARGGQMEAMRLLVAAGASAATTNRSGYTALMAGAESRKPEVVEYLLSQGADVNAATTEERTPLYYAVRNCDTPTVELLLSAGAKITPKLRKLPGLSSSGCDAVRALIEKSDAK